MRLFLLRNISVKSDKPLVAITYLLYDTVTTISKNPANATSYVIKVL